MEQQPLDLHTSASLLGHVKKIDFCLQRPSIHSGGEEDKETSEEGEEEALEEEEGRWEYEELKEKREGKKRKLEKWSEKEEIGKKRLARRMWKKNFKSSL